MCGIVGIVENDLSRPVPLDELQHMVRTLVHRGPDEEGSVTLDGRNSRVATNAFVSVPRGTAHTFEKRGNRPLMLLAVLGGEPCERAK